MIIHRKITDEVVQEVQTRIKEAYKKSSALFRATMLGTDKTVIGEVVIYVGADVMVQTYLPVGKIQEIAFIEKDEEVDKNTNYYEIMEKVKEITNN